MWAKGNADPILFLFNTRKRCPLKVVKISYNFTDICGIKSSIDTEVLLFGT